MEWKRVTKQQWNERTKWERGWTLRENDEKKKKTTTTMKGKKLRTSYTIQNPNKITTPLKSTRIQLAEKFNLQNLKIFRKQYATQIIVKCFHFSFSLAFGAAADDWVSLSKIVSFYQKHFRFQRVASVFFFVSSLSFWIRFFCDGSFSLWLFISIRQTCIFKSISNSLSLSHSMYFHISFSLYSVVQFIHAQFSLECATSSLLQCQKRKHFLERKRKEKKENG